MSIKDPRTFREAVRAKCLDCSGGNSNEVKLCPVEDCPLYPFRLGKSPYRPALSDEQRQRLSERAKENYAKTLGKNSGKES